MNKMVCRCRLFVFESPRILYALKPISNTCNQKSGEAAVNRAGRKARIVVAVPIATPGIMRFAAWIWLTALCKCVTAQSEEGRGKKKGNYF